MKLFIDYRETKLIEACKILIEGSEKFKDIIILSENLLLGDIIIRDNDNIDLLIIERKTINDLTASIKDGRYSEQSLRLKSLELHNHNIIYLIEGNIGFNNKQVVYSSMFSINYFKGFSLYRSYDIDESAYIICNAFIKIQKEKIKEPYYKTIITNELNENTTEKKDIPYCSVIKKKKSDNITPENFGEIILTQLPGISSITAIAIMKEYKTFNNLLSALKENKDVLTNFTYENDKKQKRKLNKTVLKNIFDYLTNF